MLQQTLSWTQTFFAICAFLFVPGLPIAVEFAYRTGKDQISLALAPVISLTVNYMLILVLNLCGIRIDLKIYLLEISAITIIVLIKQLQFRHHQLFQILKSAVESLPAVIVGYSIWFSAFRDHAFLAPNADGYRHNMWIARIIETHSVLPSDSYIDSPLQLIGSAKGFYPFAWHSQVAVSAQLSHLVVPSFSLLTCLVLWVFVLPLGLQQMSREFTPSLKWAGIVAGVLVQLYPIMPNAPFSWGSMTNMVGISLLPVVILVVFIAVTQISITNILMAVTCGLGLALIHTPEAASLAVAGILFLGLSLRNLTRRQIFSIIISLLLASLPIVLIFRSAIFGNTHAIRVLFGAPESSIQRAMGFFINMNFYSPSTNQILTLLLILGIGAACSLSGPKWLPWLLFSFFSVYIIAGSGSGLLNSLRLFTAPWYASTERTLWVVVPIAAILSALPIAILIKKISSVQNDQDLNLVGLFALVILMSPIVSIQKSEVISKLQNSLTTYELISNKDVSMMKEFGKTVREDEIVYSFYDDGSSYFYSVTGQPNTGGFMYNKQGRQSDYLDAINRHLTDLCDNPAARTAFKEEKVAGIIFGEKRFENAGTSWPLSEVEKIRGLKVVAHGKYLTIAKPDFSACIWTS